jgi:hypothetical protein
MRERLDRKIVELPGDSSEHDEIRHAAERAMARRKELKAEVEQYCDRFATRNAKRAAVASSLH